MNENALLDAQVLALDARRGEIVLRRVHDFLGRFVAYPSAHAQAAHALWVVHTHLMDKWDSTPRLAFLSPEPGSGKTRALEITELLVPRAVAAINVSPAYLLRKVGSANARPTILYDEIDTVFGPKAKDNEEIRGLLNAGHRRGAVAGRCVIRGKTIETEEIPAYAAVALAGLGWLPDTVLSRSVVIRMRRRKHSEPVEAFRRRVHAVEGDALRREIATWAASQTEPIAWPDMPAAIEDRDADVWEPLIAIADLAGGDWPRRARVAAVTLVTASREAEPSLGVRLLADLRAAFADAAFMATGQILSALHMMEEAPWGDLNGKPLDARGLATQLRQYGIKPEVTRVGPAVVRGYRRAALEDRWSRYLRAGAATSVTSVTSVTAATTDPAAPAVTLAAGVTPLAGWREDRRLPREDEDDPAFHAENPL
jgi:hypothetical protein